MLAKYHSITRHVVVSAGQWLTRGWWFISNEHEESVFALVQSRTRRCRCVSAHAPTHNCTGANTHGSARPCVCTSADTHALVQIRICTGADTLWPEMHYVIVLAQNGYLHQCRYVCALVQIKTDLLQMCVCTVFDTNALVQTRACVAQPCVCTSADTDGAGADTYLHCCRRVCALVQTYSWPRFPAATPFQLNIVDFTYREIVLSL